MFGAVKLITNTDPDKYYYSGYGIEFDFSSLFSFLNFDWVKNLVIFGVGNSSQVYIDNKKKIILVLGKGPSRRLADTRITAEAEYYFSRTRTKSFLYLHYNGSNSFSK